MPRETLVYRPNNPNADENGFVRIEQAEPLHIKHRDAPMVMGDLKEYRTVAADIATGGKVVIGGRRQHREFLRRNGYQELGNDMPRTQRQELSRMDRIHDIKRVIER